MNSRDHKFLDVAIKLAQSGDKVAGSRIGALLVIGNKIVSMGQNQYKSHPLQKRWGKNQEAIYLHAEIACLVNFLKSNDEEELRKATLYIARVTANDQPALAKPCEGCQGAIHHHNIRKVVYTV